MRSFFTSLSFIIFTFLMMVCNTASSQFLLTESFENVTIPDPPTGWSVQHTNNARWLSLEGYMGIGNHYDGNVCMYLEGSYYGDQSDAWLITSSVKFKAGKKYSISFYYKNQTFQNNRLQVTIGNDTTAASQTTILWDKSFRTDYYSKAQINYIATTTGTRHIGLHAVTPQTYTYIYIDKVVVEEVQTFEPLNVIVGQVTTISAKAKWSSVAGVAGYEYGISDTIAPPVSTMNTSDTAININALAAARHYYLYVRSLSLNDSSNWAIAEFSTAYDTTTIPTLTCGKAVTKNFRATAGLFTNVFCNEIYFSKEFFHKFTPSQSGYYNLNVYAVNTGQTMTFAYKDAALGAGPEGWNCIGYASDFGGKFSFGPLQAGKEYLIIEKAKASPGWPSSYTYGIDCYTPPPVNDSCRNALEILPTEYNNSCKGTLITTKGATSGNLKENYTACGAYDGVFDDEVWIKFTATANMQLFRFKGTVYSNSYDQAANPGMYFDIFSNPCDLKSLVDCGYIAVNAGETKDIISYKLKKGQTYYCRMFTADLFTYATFRMCVMNVAVTNGKLNKCITGLPYPIDPYTDQGNTNSLVPMIDSSFKLIAAVNAKGNTLNNVTGSIYVNDGALRKDGNGRFYLDRNITLKPDAQPASPINVTVYISNDELNKLIAQPGSGVSSIKDIRVTQNDDNCTSKFTNVATAFIKPGVTGIYDSTHQFIVFSVTGLSSFYLHGGNAPLVAKTKALSADVQDARIVTPTIISLFPNPVRTNLTIGLNANNAGKYNVSIIDMHGKVMKIYSKIVSSGYNEINVDCSDISAGVYFIKSETEGTTEYKKFVKQ